MTSLWSLPTLQPLYHYPPKKATDRLRTRLSVSTTHTLSSPSPATTAHPLILCSQPVRHPPSVYTANPLPCPLLCSLHSVRLVSTVHSQLLLVHYPCLPLVSYSPHLYTPAPTSHKIVHVHYSPPPPTITNLRPRSLQPPPPPRPPPILYVHYI